MRPAPSQPCRSWPRASAPPPCSCSARSPAGSATTTASARSSFPPSRPTRGQPRRRWRRCSATASIRRGSTRTAPRASSRSILLPERPARAGIGLHRLRGGAHPDQLPRRHQLGRRRVGGARRRPGLRRLPRRRRIPGTIVGWDLFNDTGLVKVDPHDHASHPSRSATRAASSSASRWRRSGARSAGGSLAVGVVSATERSIDSLTSAYDVSDAIQIDALINHGNFGGPLLDARGRVTGSTPRSAPTRGTPRPTVSRSRSTRRAVPWSSRTPPGRSRTPTSGSRPRTSRRRSSRRDGLERGAAH